MWFSNRGTATSPSRSSSRFAADSPDSPDSPYSPTRTAGSLNDEEGDGWLSDAVGSDYSYSDDSEDEDVDVEGGSPKSGKKRKFIHPDIEFEGEFLYWVVKMIRGQTSGRQLKRTIFKLCLLLMLCNFPIIVMAYIEDRTFEVGQYFAVRSPAGAALQPLMWLTGVPGFLLGFFSLYILKYWASLCTNRLLLTNITRVYMCVVLAYLVIVAYTVAVLFTTFAPVKRWTETLLLVRIFPFYVCTIIFLLPLCAGIVLSLLDLSHFVDEIVNEPGSSIEEPDPPANIMDLSDVTSQQLILFVLSMPFVIFVQFFDLCVAMWRAVKRFFSQWRRKHMEAAIEAEAEAAAAAAKRRNGVLVRLWRTLRRRCLRCLGRSDGGSLASPGKGKTLPSDGGAGTGFSASASASGGEEKMQELRATSGERDRELEERLARERLEEEAERKRLRELASAAEREAADEPRRRREAELAAAREAAELQEMRDKERLRMAPTLDVPTFKDKWATMAAAGSFSCRLRSLPELDPLTEHMRSQGFHVVFASVPSPAEVELGICNIRVNGTEPWFLARFLSSKGTFSAVMKSESADMAPAYVKKFGLAKVLKIDASSVPRSPKHGQSTNSARASSSSQPE